MEYVRRIHREDFRGLKDIVRFLLRFPNILVVRLDALYKQGYRLGYSIG